MKVNKISNVTHIQVSDNIDQFYKRNQMVQRCINGDKITYTTVELDTGNIIKRVVKHICELCQEFDCQWCKGGKQ